MTNHDMTNHDMTNPLPTRPGTRPGAPGPAPSGAPGPTPRGPRPPRRPGRLGLPVPVILALAALAAVRAPLHDLGVLDEGSALTPVLVVVPLAVWVAAALWWRVERPVLALAVVGLTYGVLLATVHQVLWTTVFAGDPPALGDNLEGVLPPTTEALLLRAAAVPSALVTGTALGVLTGALAWALDAARRRR